MVLLVSNPVILSCIMVLLLSNPEIVSCILVLQISNPSLVSCILQTSNPLLVSCILVLLISNPALVSYILKSVHWFYKYPILNFNLGLNNLLLNVHNYSEHDKLAIFANTSNQLNYRFGIFNIFKITINLVLNNLD